MAIFKGRKVTLPLHQLNSGTTGGGFTLTGVGDKRKTKAKPSGKKK